MSCYVNFFIRKNDVFAPIGSFSRNNHLFQVFEHYAPWEKVSPITYNDLKEVSERIKEEKEQDREFIEQYNGKIAIVAGMPNSTIDERLEVIHEYQGFINEVKEDIKEWDWAESYVSALFNIYDDGKYMEDAGIPDPEKYIWIGMEIGNPTMEDVSE